MSGKIQDFYIFNCFILSFIVLRPPSSQSNTHLIVISELFLFLFFLQIFDMEKPKSNLLH